MAKQLIWTPQSWRGLPISQQPDYADPNQLTQVLKRIRSYPPLVFAEEVKRLKAEIAAAATGQRFLLQGGDCAERFQDCTPEAITSKLKILLQMSMVLCYGARKPIVRIGRIAGQYSKPRSQSHETVNGLTLPSYRGDNINDLEASWEKRQADPLRLIQGYHLSALTLNYVRALTSGGFADLHHPEHWNLDFAANTELGRRYEEIIAQIKQAVDFVETLGYKENYLSHVDFYTSHEGLLLPYEEALTRYYPPSGQYYNLGAHMLWMGDRTRQREGAHAEYFRGIANPIGIKVGPNSTPDETLELVRFLNPLNEPGRLSLITRLGADQVAKLLPPLIETMTAAQCQVCWICDPMHGNAIRTRAQIKTRDFNAILAELKATFTLHQELGSHLGGVHFELTGDNVTECTGGAEGLTAEDLSRNYETACDPRLNYSQSLELAFLIATMLEHHKEI